MMLHYLVAPFLVVVWASLFSKVHLTPITFPFYTLLFLLTTFVYLTDRLIEGDSTLLRNRHQWIKNKKWSGTIVSLLLLGLSLVLSIRTFGFRMPIQLLITGAASLVYLLLAVFWTDESKLKEWIKNLLCSLIFMKACTSGLWIWGDTHELSNGSLFSDANLFVLMILLNLRLVGSCEKYETGWTSHCFILLSVLLIWGCFSLSQLVLCWMISGSLMFTVSYVPKRWHRSEFYDLVLFAPALGAHILI